MGCGRKKINDDVTSSDSELPELNFCANHCGFYGKPETMNLCSKCYRVEEEKAAAAKAAMEKLLSENQAAIERLSLDSRAEAEAEAEEKAKAAKRCSSCKKKFGVMGGFRCRCGDTFCGTHRYPEKHECTFDFKAAGKNAIAEGNPVVKADKIIRF